MAEETYQDYRRSRLGTAPSEAELAVSDVNTSESEAPAVPEAVVQDSPPVEDQTEAPDSVEQEPEVADAAAQQKRRRERNDNRFRRLNERARRVELENAELRGQIEALQAVLGRTADNPQAGQEGNGEPQRQDYVDDIAYMGALTDWKIEQRMSASQAENQEQSRPTEDPLAAARAAYGERLVEVRERYQDYDDVVSESDIRVSDTVTAALLESEQGPAIVYHLANNPDEAARLNALSPVALGRAMVALEATVGQTGGAAEPEESGTPPRAGTEATPPLPITPVSGTGSVPVTRSPDSMSYQDYKAGRRKGTIR